MASADAGQAVVNSTELRTRSGIFASMRGLLGSKKWIMRDGRGGMSFGGRGAPTQSGLVKSRGLRMGSLRHS